MFKACALLLLISPTLLSAAPAEYTQKDLNEERVVAANWQQHSPEYEALVYQAFNMARDNLNEALSKVPEGKKAAIITDIDDTLVNGAIYFASLPGTHSDKNAEASTAWWKSDHLEALPGAAGFLKEVHARNIEIFYISGRFNEVKDDTIKMMNKLGFPVKGPENILLQERSNQTLTKEGQRQKIRDQGYHILMILGDQLDDLGEVNGKLSHQKQQWVAANDSHFGKDWIFFPNVIYGSWENAVAENFNSLSPQEKHDANVSALSQTSYHQINDPLFAQQATSANLWANTSADFQALTRQAYKHAEQLLAKLNDRSLENPAIVIDINGTIVSYTPRKPDLTLTPEANKTNNYNWYVKEYANAKPIPGASEFLSSAKTQGYDIFYVSEQPLSSGMNGENRDIEQLTVNKLRELGYPDADETHVVLKGEFCSTVEKDNCNKTFQRRAITMGQVDKKQHQIALYIGDMLGDFDLREKGFDPNLKISVTANKDLFGRQYIIIPNPLNTRRLLSIYNEQAGKYMQDLSSTQQADLRRKILKTWPDNPF
jgi:5'-nucleotidase (lipoprotein e(P4) family)